jgi:hypothetical protein
MLAREMHCEPGSTTSTRKRGAQTEFACWIKHATTQAIRAMVARPTVPRGGCRRRVCTRWCAPSATRPGPTATSSRTGVGGCRGTRRASPGRGGSATAPTVPALAEVRACAAACAGDRDRRAAASRPRCARGSGTRRSNSAGGPLRGAHATAAGVSSPRTTPRCGRWCPASRRRRGRTSPTGPRWPSSLTRRWISRTGSAGRPSASRTPGRSRDRAGSLRRMIGTAAARPSSGSKRAS